MELGNGLGKTVLVRGEQFRARDLPPQGEEREFDQRLTRFNSLLALTADFTKRLDAAVDRLGGAQLPAKEGGEGSEKTPASSVLHRFDLCLDYLDHLSRAAHAHLNRLEQL